MGKIIETPVLKLKNPIIDIVNERMNDIAMSLNYDGKVIFGMSIEINSLDSNLIEVITDCDYEQVELNDAFVLVVKDFINSLNQDDVEGLMSETDYKEALRGGPMFFVVINNANCEVPYESLSITINGDIHDIERLLDYCINEQALSPNGIPKKRVS